MTPFIPAELEGPSSFALMQRVGARLCEIADATRITAENAMEELMDAAEVCAQEMADYLNENATQ